MYVQPKEQGHNRDDTLCVRSHNLIIVHDGALNTKINDVTQIYWPPFHFNPQAKFEENQFQKQAVRAGLGRPDLQQARAALSFRNPECLRETARQPDGKNTFWLSSGTSCSRYLSCVGFKDSEACKS